jgi:hypothetical protein
MDYNHLFLGTDEKRHHSSQVLILLAHLYFKGRTTKAQHDVSAALEALVSPKFAFLIK